MDKIWLVIQESDVDGEIFINVVPCISEETAKEVLKKEKETIINESFHFGKANNDDEDFAEFELEETDTTFYINDPYDDYYENITIVEKEIQY
jgi:hypothetical protein